MFFRAYLDCSLKHVAQNYLFIARSFYRNIAILSAKISRVNKALEKKKSLVGLPSGAIVQGFVIYAITKDKH
jgi:hypothetical protein